MSNIIASAEGFLIDIAARIRIEHQAVAASLKRSIEHAIAAGELLLEAKDQIPHGQWLPWLEQRCGVTPRAAQMYMRVAKHRAAIELKYEDTSHLTIADAPLDYELLHDWEAIAETRWELSYRGDARNRV